MTEYSGRLESWWSQQSVEMRVALTPLTTGDPLPGDLYWPALIQALPRGESLHSEAAHSRSVPPALAAFLADKGETRAPVWAPSESSSGIFSRMGLATR